MTSLVECGVTFDATGSYSVVVAGGGESRTVTFKVDRTGPSAVLASPANGAAYNGSVAITSSCADAGSGTTSCTTTLDGIAVPNGTVVTAPGS